LQLKGSLGNELNIGSNTVAGNYGAYIQASDNNLAVPYQLNLQPTGGNVIIGGYTDAGFKLDVNGTGRFSGNVAIGAGTQAINSDAELTLRDGVAFVGLDFKSARTSGNVGGLRFYNTSSDDVAIAQQLIETDGKFVFYNGTSGAEPRLTITSGGNVLIGTTTDGGYKLSVNGVGSFAGSATVTGTVYIQSGHQWSLNADQSGGGSPAFAGSGFYIKNENTSTIALGFNTGGAATFISSVTATSFITSSDARLKEVIKKDGDLAVYKRKGEEQIHYGYLAQEMQEIYPNQVHEAQDGFLSINYVEILIKKVNELEKKIKQLEI
jgi:hypothetical protein